MMFSDRTMFTQQASPLAVSVGGGREPMSMPMPSSMYGGGMSMGGGFNPYMMGGGYGSPFMGGMPSAYMMGGGFPQMPQMPPQQPSPQQSMQGGYPPMMEGFPPMMGGFGGFNPYMMGGGGMMGGFNPYMMGGGMMGGGFNPYMMGGGFNPYMMGGGFGFNPMPYGGYQSHQSMQQQFPGNAYTGPPPPMAPPSPPPPIGAPVRNPYSNIMPSQPLEPPTGGGGTGLGLSLPNRSPQQMQEFETFQNKIRLEQQMQEDLNKAYYAAKAKGVSFLDILKEQDALEAKLRSQYGLEARTYRPG